MQAWPSLLSPRSRRRTSSGRTTRISASRISRPGARSTAWCPASRSSSSRSCSGNCGSPGRKITMTVEWVHPGIVLIVGAWLVPLLKGRVKRVYMVLLPVAALIDCMLMTPGTYGVVRVFGQQVAFGRVDQLSLVFAYVFSLATIFGMIYSLHVDDDAQHVTALTYAGAGLGTVFAADFISLFLFWEVMAVAAALLVWLRRQPSAVAAGFRYFIGHVFRGFCLLAGIVLYWSQTGLLSFGDMSSHAGSTMFALILIAFLLNAAVPPLGAWLPAAYPPATPTGARFLTAFTTHTPVRALC